MTDMAKVAEQMNHHPHWTNVYRQVQVMLSTHDAGGLTELDFALAHAMQASVKGGRKWQVVGFGTVMVMPSGMS